MALPGFFLENFIPQKITSVFLAALVTVFFLGVGPGGYTDIMAVKLFLFLTLSLLYFAAVFLSLLLKREKRSLPRRLKMLWTDSCLLQRLLLLFWVFCGFSAVLSPFFPHTLLGFHRYEGLLTLSCYLGCFFLISIYGRARPWLLYLFAGAMTVFCLICFLQFAAWNPLWLYPEGLDYYDAGDAYRYAFLGTVGNVDLVAAVLSLSAPLFAVAVVRGKGKRRFLLLIPFFCVLGVTVLSGVAGAYVGVFGGLILSLPMAMVKKRRQKLLIWVLLLLLLAAGIAVLFCCDIGQGTLHEVHALLHGEWDDDFGTGRLFIWSNVLSLVPDRPLFGGGCDTLGQRLTVGFQRYDAEKGILYKASIDAAHNEYLNILVNEGALAFAAYMAALFVSFANFLHRSGDSPQIAIIGSGILGYCLQACFGLRLCVAAPLFWVLWGLFTASAKS